MRELVYQSKFLSWDKVLNEMMDLYTAYNDNKIFKHQHRLIFVVVLWELKKKLGMKKPDAIPVKTVVKIITIRNDNSSFMLWVYRNNKVMWDMQQYHL